MPPTIELIALLGAGLAGGLLAGLLGIGGGVVYVFVLHLFLSDIIAGSEELVRFVVANSLLATFFAGVSSSLRNARQGRFDWRAILLTALPGIVVAVSVAWSLVAYHWYNERLYSILIIALLSYMAYRMLWLQWFRRGARSESASKAESDRANATGPYRWWYPLSGALAGLLSSLSGFGGGVVIVPFLTEVARMPVKRASGISLGVIPLFALSMTLFYMLTRNGPSTEGLFSLGYILPQYTLPMTLGVWIGAQQGVQLADRLPPRLISLLFALMLLTVVGRMGWTLYTNWH